MTGEEREGASEERTGGHGSDQDEDMEEAGREQAVTEEPAGPAVSTTVGPTGML